MGQAAGRFPTAAHRAPPAAARSSSLSLLFSLFALHSSLFALGLRALPGRPLVLDASSDRYASEFVFVATRAGIYSFDRNSQVWGRQNPPESLRRWDGRSGFDDEWWDFRALGLDDGIVWVATDDGLASADVRVADWRTYHLPGRPAGFAFTDDYVWAGSDSGLLRFDKYAETWEAVSTLPVRDLLADRGGVWAATDSGVLRYNPEFDRLEPAAAHPARYDLVVATPARVWFLGPDRLAAFSRAGENWTTYPGLDVADWSALGDSLFVVAGGRALLYDPRADNWAEFRDVPGLGRVNGLHAGAARLLLATDQGLLACNWADRTRTTWNRSTGLGSDTVVDVYEDGQSVFAVTARSIEVLDKTTEAWKPEPLTRMTSRPRLVFLDETGGHLRLFPQTDVRLSGRGHYSTTAGLGAGPLSRTEYENVNLTLAARHNSGRSLSLYYDDSDKDEIMYGVGYRGVGADALARADAGFLVTDFFEFDLVPRFSTFGGSARLKWRAHGLGLQAGRLQSRLRTDFFTGRSRRRQRALDAAGFSRDVFFRIPASGRSHLSDRSDTVFVDDRSAASDTVDTRRGITLAGIRGDFDPLIRGLDYHVDDSRSIIQFTSARRSTDVIVLVSPAGEQAVQSDSVRGNALDNVYALGPGVIPGTIELAAFDDAGAPLDLHGFGLDDDRDGRVDDACLNCDLGLLVVPNPRPFPRPGNGPAWTMEAAWETRSTTYSLSGRPVVKSSETVRVDGEPLARGSDYVIDYSSGDMVLLREGLVSEFSQVEIQYSSVDRPGSSKCWSAQPVARVAPGLELAPGLAAFDSSRFGLLAARFEASGDRRSIRFVPQVALDTKLNWAQDYSLTAGWGILGLNAAWRGYSAGFQHFGTAARRYGSLAGSGEVAASVEPVTGLRFGAGLRQEDQRDSILTSDGDSAGASFGPALNPCSYTWARAGYSRPGRPAASLLLGRDHLPERSRDGVKLTLGHDLTLARTRLKLGGVVRSDRISAVGSASALDYSLSANLALPVPVTSDIYYRNSTVSNLQSATCNRSDDELRLRLGIDAVPGLYYTGTCNRRSSLYALARPDLSLDATFYNNLQVAPGRWWSGLSIVNFAAGTGSSFDEYLRELPPGFRGPWLAFSPLADGAVSSVNSTGSIFGSVQLNPRSDLEFLFRRSWNRTGSSRHGLPVLRPGSDDQARVQYQPRDWGSFIGQWTRRRNGLYPDETVDRFYLEWTNPWTGLLRTRLTTAYSLTDRDYAVAAEQSREFTLGPEVQLRFTPRDQLRLGLSLHQSSIRDLQSSIALSPSLGLNANLLRFLYLQLDYSAAIPFTSDPAHTATLKLTAQF